MGTRTSDVARAMELGSINELPVIADDIIYEGSAVGDNASGYMRPLEAGDPFRGFAESKVDNTGGQAGDVNVRLRTIGLVEAALPDVEITSVGEPVSMSDDDTFSLVANGNTEIGKVYRYVGVDLAIVYFSAL